MYKEIDGLWYAIITLPNGQTELDGPYRTRADCKIWTLGRHYGASPDTIRKLLEGVRK